MTPLPYPSYFGHGVRKCMTVPDPNIFFGEMDLPFTVEGKKMTEEAKSICATCPYMEECAAYALSNPEEKGVWGGMSEEDRRQFRRRQVRKTYSSVSATRDTP